MPFLYHLVINITRLCTWSQIFYQTFHQNWRIHKCRVDGWSHSGNVSAEKVFFSHTCFKQIYLSTKIIIIKNNCLWLSRWSCLGLLTREWGLPAELITARLHEFRRNTSSSTHNILIPLSSPSLPPPSALALICNRAHCEGGVYVYHQIRAFSLVVSSSNQQNHYCSTGEHLWEIRL